MGNAISPLRKFAAVAALACGIFGAFLLPHAQAHPQTHPLAISAGGDTSPGDGIS